LKNIFLIEENCSGGLYARLERYGGGKPRCYMWEMIWAGVNLAATYINFCKSFFKHP
jgi:hypothetical protein